MHKKGDTIHSDVQNRLEEAVLNYQLVAQNKKIEDINDAYIKITNLYNPLDFHGAWYDQYKYFQVMLLKISYK